MAFTRSRVRSPSAPPTPAIVKLAWIFTQGFPLTFRPSGASGRFGSSDLEAEPRTAPPREPRVGSDAAGIDQDRIVSPAGQVDDDFIFGHGDPGGGVEEAPEDLTGLGVFEAAQGPGQLPVDSAGDDGQ